MEEISEVSERELRRQRMKEFYQMTHILFTKPERLIIYKILKDYKRRCDLDRLIVGLSLVLRTYTKLELLKYIRYFLWEGHLIEFDTATKFHSRFRPRRKDVDGGRYGSQHLLVPDRISLASGNTRTSGTSRATTSSSRHIKDVRVLTLHKSPGRNGLGFSVRGGSEHGLGIYVSEIDVGSTAEKSGLEVGDKILEANNISLKGVASSSAVKVLTGSNRLKLVIQRTRKVPEWRLSREKTSWYDVHDDRLISGEFEECGISHHIRGLDVDVLERRVNLKFHSNDNRLGFNIRGGREYGLGIYVSKVDKEGQADKNGVRVGDQIIDVNGIPFENITHAHAVEVLKGKQHLILTLRDVGRYPVYKELYAEYTWSDGHLKAASSVTSLRDIHFEKQGLQHKAQSVSDIFTRNRRPNALRNEIFLPSKPPRQKLRRNNGHSDEEVLYESDSDSLVNIEQWTQHLGDSGMDNNGYMSDNENDDNHGMGSEIHGMGPDRHGMGPDITVTKYGHVQESEYEDSNSLHENDNINGHNDSNINEEVDDLYSKITKVKRYPEQNETMVHIENLNKSDTMTYTYKHDADEDKHQDTTDNTTDEYASHTDTTRDGKDEIVSSIQVETCSENTSHLYTAKPEGALYSQIHRKGSYFDISPQQPGTSSSNNDLTTSIEYKTKTLHARKSSSSTESSDDSDVEISKTSKRKGISRQYDVQQMETKVSYSGNKFSKRGETGNKSTSPKRNEMFSVDDLEDRLKDLERRQMSLGLNELNSLSPKHDTGSEDSPTHKKGKWKNFKEKIKGSLRIKTTNVSNSKSESVRSRGFFREKRQNTIDEYNLASLEEEAKKMLSPDEFEAVMRRVKNYHETHELERLVEILLAILDKPEKLLLLRDVRGVIYAMDMVKFDNMVNVYEIEAYQKLSMKLHLPLNHKPQKKPRKTLMATEIDVTNTDETTTSPTDDAEAEDGHFHLRPLDQYQKEEEVVEVLKENVDDSRHGSPNKQPMRKKSLEEASVMGQFDYLDNEQSEDNLSVIISSDPGSYGSSEVERTPGAVIVHLSKNKPDIGIDLTEANEHGLRDIRISKIHLSGAANDDSTIQVGMSILAVDNHRIEGCSAEEARGILQKIYSNKHIVSMKLILHKPETTHF